MNQCEYMSFLGSLEEPPEQCQEEALEDDDFCVDHWRPDVWDRADEAYAYGKGWD
jgi:hypothetical protein